MAANVAETEGQVAKMSPSDPERKKFDGAIASMKAELNTRQAAEARLREQESELLNAMSTEQARWTDFNNRLDQLEQSLPRR